LAFSGLLRLYFAAAGASRSALGAWGAVQRWSDTSLEARNDINRHVTYRGPFHLSVNFGVGGFQRLKARLGSRVHACIVAVIVQQQV
jgi:hypothetical protein